MIAANEMGPDMNVIYVKRLNYLIPISQNFIDYTNPEFSASAKMNFFWIRVAPNIEFRNWDNFESKLEDPVQFLERLEIYRTCFRKGLKNRLKIENHYTYTKAKD